MTPEMPTLFEYEERMVAFVDILGWKRTVDNLYLRQDHIICN